jgi:threonine/homoserine/homoserine lactone efflux protein
MELSVLLKALFIGFAMAMPLGPVGILCLRRALTQGSAFGFLSGLGMAAGDALYGGAARMGLQPIWSFAQGHQGWLTAFAGLLLLAMAGRSVLFRPRQVECPVEATRLAGAFVSAFFLTLLNPTTILSFAAFYAALDIPVLWGGTLAAIPLVLGIFLGSALCGLLMSVAAGGIRRRLKLRALVWSQRLAGLLVGGMGLVTVLASLL